MVQNNFEKLEEPQSITDMFGRQKIRLYKIKHIIFDFGGVMIEKTFVLKNLLDIFESDLNISIPRSESSYFRKLRRQVSSGILSSREFLETIFDKYYYPYQIDDGALPAKKVNIDYYLELWFQLYSMVTHISSEMEEIIERFHQAGYICSLMSNTYDIHARSNELRGFYDAFDHLFLSNEIGLVKPNIEKYKHVLNKLNTKPKKCIFIDDKIANLIPARELGIIVVMFESLEKFKEQLNELGINKISPNLRAEIKKKYKKYKKSKKAYKTAKKEYKKARKDYLKKKTRAKRYNLYQLKHAEYKKKKKVYKKEKKKKKDLISKVSVA